MAIDPHETVDETMRRLPETIAVFLRRRMHCIGCPVGRIHTIAEACAEHRLDLAEILADLRRAVAKAEKAAAAEPKAKPERA